MPRVIKRQPKKIVGIRLPPRVISEVKKAALRDKVSVSMFMLGILRDQGFSVKAADFIDARKAR